MRSVLVTVLSLILTSAAMAQIKPGAVVPAGEPFPLMADFNGDGLDDIIQERNVVLNDGTGFTQVVDLGLPAREKVIAVLDVNGDHIPDLLTVGGLIPAPVSLDPNPIPDYFYKLYIGNASHVYANGASITSGPRPYVADVDGDGNDDILVFRDIRPDTFRTVATEVTVLRSLGDGNFERMAPFQVAPMPQILPWQRVLTGDLNHDGHPDLIMRGPDDLIIARGTGGGHFIVENRYLPDNADYGTQSAQLADIDGDGNLDVILPGQRRTIRVLYGDGHGNFPRMSMTSIAELHPPQGYPVLLHAPDEFNQPRDITIGHFTSTTQNQVAAGMGEGDLVILGYDGGALKEVSRTATEFWLPTVHAGNFHGNGFSDVYAMGTYVWGEMYARPHVFNGAGAGLPVNTAVRVPGRLRASRTPAEPAAVEHILHMQISGDCINEPTEHWALSGDGVFERADVHQTTFEAVFDGSNIYFRINAAYTIQPATGVMTGANGMYGGTTLVVTPCGLKTMMVAAMVEK